MRAAANKPNINIVAVNDPFISVDYSKYSVVYMCQRYYNHNTYIFISNLFYCYIV